MGNFMLCFVFSFILNISFIRISFFYIITFSIGNRVRLLTHLQSVGGGNAALKLVADRHKGSSENEVRIVVHLLSCRWR